MTHKKYEAKVYSEANFTVNGKKSIQIIRQKVTSEMTFWINPKELSLEEIGEQVGKHLILRGYMIVGDVEVKKIKVLK